MSVDGLGFIRQGGLGLTRQGVFALNILLLVWGVPWAAPPRGTRVPAIKYMFAGGRAGCTHVMHGRSRMTIDLRIPKIPGWSTSTRQTLLAPSAKRREELDESHEG